MSQVTFPSFKIGDPVRYQSLAIFPLISERSSDLAYQLSDEAISAEHILVEEINESGSVPELYVESKGDTQVLFLEGEELIGAKQNRILNTSVMVAAKSKIKIPVSCVEQGRWSYHSRRFHSSGSHSPSKLRHSLKSSVTRSVREGEGHRSDQSEVWSEVADLQSKHGVESCTMAMSDTFSACEDAVTDYREKLPYVQGATGLAILVGDRMVSIDLFDKPSTCEKVWNRLISGSILEAMAAQPTDKVATAADVERLLQTAKAMQWESAPAVGEGQEYRAESQTGEQASLLFLNETLVHGSVVVG